MAIIAGQTTLRVSTTTQQTNNSSSHSVRGTIVGIQAPVSNLAAPNGADVASSNQTFDANAGVAATISVALDVVNGAPTAGDLKVSYSIRDDLGNTIVAKTAIITLAGGFAASTQYTGTASWTPTLCGTYELVLYLDYAQTTNDAVNGKYVANSLGTYTLTGTPNLWNTTLRGADRGYLRMNTTATTVLTAGPLAYGDSLTATITTGVNAVTSSFVNVATAHNGSTSSVSSTTQSWSVHLHAIDNTYPASSGVETSVTTFPTSPFSGVSWMRPTTLTEGSVTVDPRLTYTHLHQDNDNTFGTTPMTKDAGIQRLTSNLAFLSARLRNANGVGQNGIVFGQSLQDAGHLVTAETDSLTTATEGTEAGWGNGFLTWADQLPGGNWTKTCTITSPAGAVGLDANASITYQLIASNPNLRVVCGGGPGTVATDTKHFIAGDPFIAGLAIFDTEQNVLVEPDSSTALIALGRLNLATGKAEYLASDSVTWTDAGAASVGSPVYYFPASETFAGSKVWVVTFTGANTSGWGVADIFAIGKAKVGGVPVSSMQKEILVSGINNHDKYRLNPINFVMG